MRRVLITCQIPTRDYRANYLGWVFPQPPLISMSAQQIFQTFQFPSYKFCSNNIIILWVLSLWHLTTIYLKQVYTIITWGCVFATNEILIATLWKTRFWFVLKLGTLLSRLIINFMLWICWQCNWIYFALQPFHVFMFEVIPVHKK